jgi:hypothetical protein
VEQKEPATFDEAWNHDDPRAQEKWQEAITKEFEEMKKKEVWEIMKKEGIPQERRTIKCKWIFKIKRNGVFRVRLVACGYSQIPGIDFNESFAPVVNDVSFRIVLIAKLIWDLQASIMNVETAFLHVLKCCLSSGIDLEVYDVKAEALKRFHLKVVTK